MPTLIFNTQVIHLSFNKKSEAIQGFLQHSCFAYIGTLVKSTDPFVPNAPFLYPLAPSEKPYGFLMFSGIREGVHWEQMGQTQLFKRHHTKSPPTPKTREKNDL